METADTIRELWRMFLRRIWILAGIGVLGIGLAAFVAYVLPPVFQAEAKILVESQQIPDDLARSTVTASAAERLQLIQQRLMTRDNLRRVIEDLRLFDNRPDLSVSEKIELLRESTSILPIATSGRRPRTGAEISAFTIQVAFTNANDAARIANQFVTMVLAQNIQARSRRASETLEFFTKEEARIAAELVALEARITEYKDKNQDALPDTLDYRRQELARLTENDLNIDLRLLELEERRGALEVSLKEAILDPAPARSPEEQQLRQLEAALAQKRAIYAESHREIRAIRAQIAALRASLPASAGGEAVESNLQESQVAAIRQQIELLDNQVALLREQKAGLVDVRAALKASIDRTPHIEMELNSMYRRHAELQAQYRTIAQKRTEAETGEKLEINQQAERFEVIENAIPPEEPVSPNRKKIVVFGSGMSMALAFGLAYLVEMLRPALRSAAQMERQLDLRPVVTIPYITTRSERRWRAIRIMAFLVVVFAGIPAGLYAIDQYYLPLELIGNKISESSGLGEAFRMIENRL